MPDLHPRYQIVRLAASEIGQAASEIAGNYNLTYHELVGVLLDIARSWTKYGIRTERHPDDPDKKGDEG